METVNLAAKAVEHLDDDIHFQEVSLQEMQDALDPSGWIIQYADQLSEADGTYIRLNGKNGEVEATAVITPAATSKFQALTGLPAASLENAAYISSIWVSPDAITSEVLPAVLYLALRRARIWNKQNIVALIPIPNKDVPLATLLKMDKLNNVDIVERDGQQYLPVAQRLKYSILNIYEQCDGEYVKLIKNHFANEIVETHYAWLERFYQGSWASSVINRTLSREQYVSSLYNLHEYVKHTTRLCARAIAFCDDVDLRNHYINHFRGEINHEIILERDLKHLGADINYLKSLHIPTAATKEFMLVQESTIGFYQDPVLMLACPLTAEGVAAHMRQDFIDRLLDNISGWDVKKPIEAARFLTSHVNTDGGDDGHWINVVTMLQRYIKDEHHMQQFLSVMTAAMNGFERGFNANIEDLQLWSAKPETAEGAQDEQQTS